jgi:hypothetical protein
LISGAQSLSAEVEIAGARQSLRAGRSDVLFTVIMLFEYVA